MKVLIRAPNWVGDAVMALPAIGSFLDNNPDSQVFIGATGWSLDVFTGMKGIAGTVSFPADSRWKSLKESAKKIKALDIDVGLLLSNSFHSAFGFYLAGLSHRWGYARDGRRFLLTRGIEVGKDKGHQVHYYLNLVKALGFSPSRPKLFFPLGPEDRSSALDLLTAMGVDTRKQMVILNPGAKYGSAKRWPASRFGVLAAMILDHHKAEVLVIGSEDEQGLAEDITRQVKAKIHVLTGKTRLRELAGITAAADLFVTNDSGPMHLANALGCPVVALFGPTDPRCTGPYQPPYSLIQKEVPCWPCLYRACPYDHRCMELISPEEVYQQCRAFLR